MDKEQASRFLRACGSPPLAQSSSGWLQGACPLAAWKHKGGRDDHPSFGVHINPGGESLFKCFSCGQGGDLDYLVQLLTHYGAQAPKFDMATLVQLLQAEGEQGLSLEIADPGAKKAATPVVPWPSTYLTPYPRAWLQEASRAYLESRGVSHSTAILMDIRWDPHGQMICFPIRDFDNNLTGLRCRRLAPEDDQPKYHIQRWNGHANGAVWYGEHRVNFEKPVLMVESVFDVAAVMPHYDNVLSPMTAGMSAERIERVGFNISQVVTLFDADDAGAEARKKISRYMGHAIVQHLLPPDGCKDPGEMGPEKIKALLVDILPHVR